MTLVLFSHRQVRPRGLPLCAVWRRVGDPQQLSRAWHTLGDDGRVVPPAGSAKDGYSRAMPRSLGVARLIISEATAGKLSAKHGLDHREVHDAIVGMTGLRYAWHDHPERGRRALVEFWIGDRRCVAVLYPVDDVAGDVYALGSAYPR